MIQFKFNYLNEDSEQPNQEFFANAITKKFISKGKAQTFMRIVNFGTNSDETIKVRFSEFSLSAISVESTY